MKSFWLPDKHSLPCMYGLGDFISGINSTTTPITFCSSHGLDLCSDPNSHSFYYFNGDRAVIYPETTSNSPSTLARVTFKRINALITAEPGLNLVIEEVWQNQEVLTTTRLHDLEIAKATLIKDFKEGMEKLSKAIEDAKVQISTAKSEAQVEAQAKIATQKLS
ncbi:hypothetical protein ACH5RR_025904 [Cinchona calisaya]|uniref:Uncharacterized protein n=1 Tax=Cinchona calisaya TaxID=153742 RepID=A0ABD2Z471_9GENT